MPIITDDSINPAEREIVQFYADYLASAVDPWETHQKDPITVRLQEDSRIKAQGGRHYDKRPVVFITSGTILEIDTACRGYLKWAEKNESHGFNLPSDVVPILCFLWIFLHESHHSYRNHSDPSNTDIEKAKNKIGEKAFYRATEYDADAMATAKIWYSICKRHPNMPVINQKGACLEVVHLAMQIIRKEASEEDVNHGTPAKRFWDCMEKIAQLGNVIEGPPPRTDHKTRLAELQAIAEYGQMLDRSFSRSKGYPARRFSITQEEALDMTVQGWWHEIAPIIVKDFPEGTYPLPADY